MKIVTVNCGNCSYDVEKRDLASLLVSTNHSLTINAIYTRMYIVSGGRKYKHDDDEVAHIAAILYRFCDSVNQIVVRTDMKTASFHELERGLLHIHERREYREELRSGIDNLIRENRRLHDELSFVAEDSCMHIYDICAELERDIYKNYCAIVRTQQLLRNLAQ